MCPCFKINESSCPSPTSTEVVVPMATKELYLCDPLCEKKVTKVTATMCLQYPSVLPLRLDQRARGQNSKYCMDCLCDITWNEKKKFCTVSLRSPHKHTDRHKNSVWRVQKFRLGSSNCLLPVRGPLRSRALANVALIRCWSGSSCSVLHVHAAGVNTAGCGSLTLRVRPALIFQSQHAEIFLDAFDKVLNESK